MVFSNPVENLVPGDFEYENTPLINKNGFREYDARWLMGEQLNLVGVQSLGAGLGTLLNRKLGENPSIVIGHDYRSYSCAVKLALSNGLISAGCKVTDIGLSLTPMAYFAQFALDIPAVAMITASHNPNGWTGVKMGLDKPVTFGPENMSELKTIVLNGEQITKSGGSYNFVNDFRNQYIQHLTNGKSVSKPLKVVVACGNGTAGAFAPQVMREIGCEVIEVECDLDHSFPNHDPNPEDLRMMSGLSRSVKEHKADIGLAFDGDGDRCGVIDEKGKLHFSDRIGLMIARTLAEKYPNSKLVVDVKSTASYSNDSVLAAGGITTEYWKTGHSHMKRRVRDSGAIAGFEKSGHMFLAPPIGLGYDDGVAVGVLMCEILSKSIHPLSFLMQELGETFNSPTMSAHCDDEIKYHVVDKIVAYFEELFSNNKKFGSKKIANLNTINGVRATFTDGSWILARASSNAPELVFVIESPNSQACMHEIFASCNKLIAKHPEIGDFNQTLGDLPA